MDRDSNATGEKEAKAKYSFMDPEGTNSLG